jgi:hypothetical protein
MLVVVSFVTGGVVVVVVTGGVVVVVVPAAAGARSLGAIGVTVRLPN